MINPCGIVGQGAVFAPGIADNVIDGVFDAQTVAERHDQVLNTLKGIRSLDAIQKVLHQCHRANSLQAGKRMRC